jgi:hypothetical protein
MGRALFLGVLSCSGATATHATEAPDPILPGARNGVLQRTFGGSVLIDGVKYPLAAQAMIQTSKGSVLSAKLLETLNGQRVKVQYVVGTGTLKGEIVRIVLPAQR